MALCWWVAAPDFQRAKWPTTTLTVTQYDTRSYSDPDGLALEIPYARMHYTVNGTTYDQQVDVGLATNDQGALASAKSKYPVGSTHTVPYNPANPKELRPEPLLEGFPMFALFFGFIVSLGAVLAGLKLLVSPRPVASED